MISHFGSAERIFTVPKGKLLGVPGIGPKTFGLLNLQDALR